MKIELRRGRANSMGAWYSSDLYDEDDYYVDTTPEICYSGYSEEEIHDLELKRHAAKALDRLEKEMSKWEGVLGE